MPSGIARSRLGRQISDAGARASPPGTRPGETSCDLYGVFGAPRVLQASEEADPLNLLTYQTTTRTAGREAADCPPRGKGGFQHDRAAEHRKADGSGQAHDRAARYVAPSIRRTGAPARSS